MTPCRRAAAPAVLACLALAACDGPVDESPALGAFSPCADEPALECATFDLPLIHGSKDERRTLADVVRWPALRADPAMSGSAEGASDDDAPRLLVVLADDPGASGADAVRALHAADALPWALRERHDVVGLARRGLGTGDRVDCGRLGLDAPAGARLDADGLAARAVRAARVADACEAEYGRRLKWLGTHAAVQDVNALREALGAPIASLLARGYGTRLAALHLVRYPRTSGRVVLDGSVPPDGDPVRWAGDRARALQRSLDALLAGCGAVRPGCDPDAVGAALEARARRPRTAEERRAEDRLDALLLRAAEAPDLGALALPVIVDAALDGATGPVDAFLATFAGADGPGSTGAGATVARAVRCADDVARPSADGLAAAFAALAATAPTFAGAALAPVADCAGWPSALVPIRPLGTERAPPALVVGGLGDARAPIAWGEAMAEAIGAVHLDSDHAGHGAVFTGASACVDALALAYLLDGTLPVGASCTSGPDGEGEGR